LIRALVVIAASTILSSPVSSQQRPLETLRTAEFLSLPESIQGIYVAGILDGMSYIVYGYNDPSLGAWTDCVQQATLGQTTAEVVDWLTLNPGDQDDPVPWALSQVIGARGCPR
jgi:hypothetical protein